MILQKTPLGFPLTFILLLLGSLTLSGQQSAQYSLFNWNKMAWNPAFAGLDHSLSVTGHTRSQWQGIDGNPETQQINAHVPVYFINSGFGLLIENDATGPMKNLRIGLNYSYQLNLANGILALGLGLEQIQRRLDGSKLRTPDGTYADDLPPDHADAVLTGAMVNGRVLNFNGGVYYYSEKFEAGLSVMNMTEPLVDLESSSVVINRHYFAYASYEYRLGSSFTLQPAIQISMVKGQLQTNMGATIHYNDNIFAGASFRGYSSSTSDAVAILAGFKLSENLMLGYGYDAGLSGLVDVHSGSHEILINYNLNKRIFGGRLPKIIYNPRSL